MLHRPVVGPVILLISGEPARMIGFRAVVAGASTFNVVVRPPKPTATLHRKSLGIVPVTWEKWYPTYGSDTETKRNGRCL